MTTPLDPETKRLRAMTPGQLADKVGALKAAIADIDEQLEAIKGECVRLNLTSAQGALFDITVSPPGERKSLDKDALVADFGVELVEQRYTKTTIGTAHTLRCTARKQRVRVAVAA
jgi:hypothetical protein